VYLSRGRASLRWTSWAVEVAVRGQPLVVPLSPHPPSRLPSSRGTQGAWQSLQTYPTSTRTTTPSATTRDPTSPRTSRRSTRSRATAHSRQTSTPHKTTTTAPTPRTRSPTPPPSPRRNLPLPPRRLRLSLSRRNPLNLQRTLSRNALLPSLTLSLDTSPTASCTTRPCTRPNATSPSPTASRASPSSTATSTGTSRSTSPTCVALTAPQGASLSHLPRSWSSQRATFAIRRRALTRSARRRSQVPGQSARQLRLREPQAPRARRVRRSLAPGPARRCARRAGCSDGKSSR